MGRRKLGQPRVHRIIVIDQYSNEIESHELDEFGRLKEKISNVKKRAVNLLTNNNNNNNQINIQMQHNNNIMNSDQTNSAIKFPQPLLNSPNHNIQNKPLSLNATLNNTQNINKKNNDSQNNNQNYNGTSLRFINTQQNSNIKPSFENTDKYQNQTHNSLKETSNSPVNKYKNIPQPQISMQTSKNNQQVSNENVNKKFENINGQTINNSIPLPIVKSQNLINQSSLVPKSYLLEKRIGFPSTRIIINGTEKEIQHPLAQNNQQFANSFYNYYKYQKIFELPEEPAISLFLIEDE